jgi:hypothetical protein
MPKPVTHCGTGPCGPPSPLLGTACCNTPPSCSPRTPSSSLPPNAARRIACIAFCPFQRTRVAVRREYPRNRQGPIFHLATDKQIRLKIPEQQQQQQQQQQHRFMPERRCNFHCHSSAPQNCVPQPAKQNSTLHCNAPTSCGNSYGNAGFEVGSHLLHCFVARDQLDLAVVEQIQLIGSYNPNCSPQT